MGKEWFKSVSRQVPFYTVEYWRYTYFYGWPKFLGFTMPDVIYHGQKGVYTLYRTKKEWDSFIRKMELLMLKNPEKMMYFYSEHERLDSFVLEMNKRKLKTKKELRGFIIEIKGMMKYYATLALIKTYSNFAMTDKVRSLHPEIAKKGESLISHTYWHNLGEVLADNAAKILKINKKDAEFMKLDELIKCIDTGYIDIELIRNRQEKFAWNLGTDRIYFGRKADECIKRLRVEEKSSSSDALKGMIASKGIAIGKAVIGFHIDDFRRLKKGDIIVTHMTAPWHAPYLKNVAAIVTEEGGIGTHASIISRELKIPCIVGVTNATKMIKDGEMIVVDADNGIVRKK